MPEDAHRMRSATRSAIQPRCLCGEPWPCRYAVTDPMPSWTTGRWLCALCRAWGDGGADGLDPLRDMQQGRDDERAALLPILTDLIAELRGLNQNRDGGMWAEDVHEAADRAEARLRKVTGDE